MYIMMLLQGLRTFFYMFGKLIFNTIIHNFLCSCSGQSVTLAREKSMYAGEAMYM